jgi:two-component system phosphate regulon response regulator PhoB
MNPQRILAVDDEADILELVQHNLTREGFEVILARDGENALRLAEKETPVFILLDWMLPGMSGLDILKHLKNNPKTERIPVVMLTVKNADADVALGLELGADDYITKPFSPRVLVARVRAILRRKTAQPSESGDVLQIGDLLMHVGRHEAALKGDMIDLTVTEFRLLHLLALKPGWVFTRNQIIDSVRGENIAVTDRSVDAHIVTLRKKLGAYGTLIETVRGMGYRFKSLENK